MKLEIAAESQLISSFGGGLTLGIGVVLTNPYAPLSNC
jgi:hypothetical protein